MASKLGDLHCFGDAPASHTAFDDCCSPVTRQGTGRRTLQRSQGLTDANSMAAEPSAGLTTILSHRSSAQAGRALSHDVGPPAVLRQLQAHSGMQILRRVLQHEGQFSCAICNIHRDECLHLHECRHWSKICSVLTQLNMDGDIATSWQSAALLSSLSKRQRAVPLRCIGIGSQSQSWSGWFCRAGPISTLLAAGPPSGRQPGLKCLEQQQVFSLACSAFECSMLLTYPISHSNFMAEAVESVRLRHSRGMQSPELSGNMSHDVHTRVDGTGVEGTGCSGGAPDRRRTRRTFLPRYLVSHADASSPSSWVGPLHSQMLLSTSFFPGPPMSCNPICTAATMV